MNEHLSKDPVRDGYMATKEREVMSADQRVDLSKAHNKLIVRNHWEDPTYAPYCMRCRGLDRMKVIEPYLFAHKCGAIHDERQVLS